MTNHVQGLIKEKGQSPYKTLEGKIFDRAMSELKFIGARAEHDLEVKSLNAYLEDGSTHQSRPQVEAAIRSHAKTRVSEMILENANYPADRIEQDPHRLADLLENTFPSWLSPAHSHSEGISALNNIANEVITKFRAERQQQPYAEMITRDSSGRATSVL